MAGGRPRGRKNTSHHRAGGKRRGAGRPQSERTKRARAEQRRSANVLSRFLRQNPVVHQLTDSSPHVQQPSPQRPSPDPQRPSPQRPSPQPVARVQSVPAAVTPVGAGNHGHDQQAPAPVAHTPLLAPNIINAAAAGPPVAPAQQQRGPRSVRPTPPVRVINPAAITPPVSIADDDGKPSDPFPIDYKKADALRKELEDELLQYNRALKRGAISPIMGRLLKRARDNQGWLRKDDPLLKHMKYRRLCENQSRLRQQEPLPSKVQTHYMFFFNCARYFSLMGNSSYVFG